MVRLLRIGLVTLVSLASVGFWNDASAQPPPRASIQTSTAPMVILFDPHVVPLSELVVDATLKSPQLIDQAAKEAATVDGDATAGYPLVHSTEFVADTGAGGTTGRLAGVLEIEFHVEPPDKEIDARLVWEAIVEELEKTLSATAQRLDQRGEEQWNLERDFLRAQRNSIQERSQEALNATRIPNRVANAADELQQLSSKRRDVSLQLAGTEARRQALQDRIQQLKASSETAELDREIIEQLEKVVAVQEHALEATRQAFVTAQAVTEFQVTKAEGEVAKARIDLLRAKKEAAAKSSPELEALADELSNTTIAAAEQRAVLKQIEAGMKELEVALSVQAEQMQDAQEAQERLAILREQLATIERRLAAMELERLERTVARGGKVEIVPWSVPSAED